MLGEEVKWCLDIILKKTGDVIFDMISDSWIDEEEDTKIMLSGDSWREKYKFIM